MLFLMVYACIFCLFKEGGKWEYFEMHDALTTLRHVYQVVLITLTQDKEVFLDCVYCVRIFVFEYAIYFLIYFLIYFHRFPEGEGNAETLKVILPSASPSAFQHYLYLQEFCLLLWQCQVYIIIPDVICILIRNDSSEFGAVLLLTILYKNTDCV